MHYLQVFRPVLLGRVTLFLMVSACGSDSLHSVVGLAGTEEGERKLLDGVISTAQLADLVPIDSIRYEVTECNVGPRYVLTLTESGQAEYIGSEGAFSPTSREGSFDPFDFARLADLVLSTDVVELANDAAPTAIHGDCYDLRMWRNGETNAVRWTGIDSPGGRQDLWLLRSAIMGMTYRIAWGPPVTERD